MKLKSLAQMGLMVCVLTCFAAFMAPTSKAQTTNPKTPTSTPTNTPTNTQTSANLIGTIEQLWQLQNYAEAARVIRTHTSSEAKFVLWQARLALTEARNQDALRLIAVTAYRFGARDPSRVDAFDIAARAAMALGNRTTAAQYARLSCLAAKTDQRTTSDGLDLFCKRVPAALLSRLNAERPKPLELQTAHSTAMSVERPVIDVMLNGRETPALIDSGSEASFILARDVARFGVRRTGLKTAVVGFTNDLVEVEWAIADTIELAGWQLQNIPVLVLPNVFPDGAIPRLVIGLAELWPFRTSFDFKEQTLTIERSQPKTTPIPRNAMQIGWALRVPIKTLNTTLYATLDTGSERLILSRARLLAQQGIMPPSFGPSGSVTGISGSLPLISTILPKLEFFGQTRDQVWADIAEVLPEMAGAIMGLEFLRSGQFVIDLSREGAFLQASP